MKRFIFLVIVFLEALIITGCGGSSSSATFNPSAPLITPQITFYGTNLDLSNTVISAMSSNQGLLVNCPTGGTDIQLSQYVGNSNGGWSDYYVLISGNFSLPNGGQIHCNTTGITGTINRERFSIGNNLVFDITNLNLPANSMQSGWQSYWKAILNQTGQVISTQSSGAIITCKNSMNVTITKNLITVGDISTFIKQCIN